MRRVILTILCLSLSSFLFAYDLDEIYDIIKYVESSNNPKAIGDDGRAYGVVQIHKSCVMDINRLYNTNYTHKQAFDEAYSREMFMLYMSYGIKRFKKRYCRSPTEEEVVRFWNGGIYKGYKMKATKKYYKKYLRYKKLLQ